MSMYKGNEKILNSITSVNEENMRAIAKEEAMEVYSTDEQVVGTWIDGKPLYQKTIFSSFTNYTTGDFTIFSIPFSNINAIYIDGMVNYDSTHPVPVNYYYENSTGNTQRISTYYDKNLGSIQTVLYCSTSTNYANANYFVTIRYTKTTD